MRTVVMTDGRVAIKAERNSVVDVGTTWIKVCNLDSDAHCASTQAAMTRTPEQHTYLVLFPKVILSPGHARSLLLRRMVARVYEFQCARLPKIPRDVFCYPQRIHSGTDWQFGQENSLEFAAREVADPHNLNYRRWKLPATGNEPTPDRVEGLPGAERRKHVRLEKRFEGHSDPKPPKLIPTRLQAWPERIIQMLKFRL
jgi:hypothetical protein